MQVSLQDFIVEVAKWTYGTKQIIHESFWEDLRQQFSKHAGASLQEYEQVVKETTTKHKLYVFPLILSI